MNNIAIIIHAYQHPSDLKQCLTHIKNAPYVSNCSILVVDNSYDAEMREKNRMVIDSFKSSGAIFYLDQETWESFTESGSFSSPEKEMMRSVILGYKGWSTHHARNAGMLYSRHILQGIDYTFNLDQDIILDPQTDLRFLDIGYLGSASISGCPDLSRLEWVGFYHLYLSEILGAEVIRSSQDYAHRMINKNPFETVENILIKYTDFTMSRTADPDKIEPPDFLQREEYYGACYLSALQNTDLLIPEWYDNDWFFFQHTRKNRDEVQFLPVNVHHASVRKSINNTYGYEVEEYGKAVNDIYDKIEENGSCDQSIFEQAVRKRLKIIQDEIDQNKILQAMDKNGKYISCLQDIQSHMESLKKTVMEYEIFQILSDIRNYNSQAALWRSAACKISLNTDKICREA